MSLDIQTELSTPRPLAADRPRWSAILQSAIRASADMRPRGIGTHIVGKIAVVPVVGPIGFRSALARYYGCEITDLQAELSMLATSRTCDAIVLDVDSPGGSVDGVPELAAKIRSITTMKPVVAVARPFMASAAYWLASAANVVLSMRSGCVGSIGVWCAHIDVSGFEEKMGVKTTLIASSPEKVEGHPYAPLSDEARATMQKSVDAHYKSFSGDVAKFRGITVTRNHARCLDAPDAAKERLIDGMVEGTSAVVEMAGALADMGPRRRQAFARCLDLARYDGTPAADVAVAALSRTTGDGSYAESWQRQADARERELARLGG